MEIKNTLTIEEKLSLFRFDTHGLISMLGDIVSHGGEVYLYENKNYDYPLEDSMFFMSRSKLPVDFIRGVCSLGNNDYIEVEDLYIENLFKQINSVVPFESDIQEDYVIQTLPEAMSFLIFNLIREADRRIPGKAFPTFEVYSVFEKSLENMTYVPDSVNGNDFVKFRVSHKGETFPDGFDLKQKLTKLEDSDRGFGMFYTGIMSRLLGAPVNVTYDGNETGVEFYHPIFED